MNEIAETGQGVLCANCATAMVGEFCHECGQSIHSVLKPAHHMLEDTMDIVFHVDGRVMHTLPPLLTKPGFLTLEYFSGRRVRYVAPFRLMFVLCLLAFFLGHLALDQFSGLGAHQEAGVDSSGPPSQIGANAFAQATTAQEVRDRLNRQMTQLQTARAAGGGSAGLDEAESRLRRQADTRLAQLQHKAAAEAPAEATSQDEADPADDDDGGSVNVNVPGLPQFMKARILRGVQHIAANIRATRHGTEAQREEAIERMKAGIFGVLPQTMFVLMPVFALLLKLLYLFRRRLYMEHLIVALHSHAFLFLNVILSIALLFLGSWLTPHASWLGPAFHLAQWALALWALAYLWLMQKRVYRQGWLMTSVKYFAIGWCYVWMLAWALLFAVILGAAH
ncbi:DUF3667 domain-containing protein [Dyella sp.]|uniref:DUF3667 domain-containing protein n=1 Tax=Dyella sp. TaxID=1869338 RepID=UPI002ED6BE56